MATNPSALNSLPGGPVQGMNPPPGWAIRMAQLMQQNRFAQALAPVGQAVQAAQNKVGQLGDSFVNYMANRTPNQAPANQQAVADIMRIGAGAYGLPIPTAQQPPADHPRESVVAPEGGEAEEGSPLAFAKAQGIKIPKGQQKDAVIQANIEQAAKNGNTILMTYQNPEWDESKVYHLEPYSYRAIGPDGKPMPVPPKWDGDIKLWAYDRTGKGIRSFSTDNIINVTPTEQGYTPRLDPKTGKPWTVEIGQGAATGANPKAGSSAAEIVPSDELQKIQGMTEDHLGFLTAKGQVMLSEDAPTHKEMFSSPSQFQKELDRGGVRFATHPLIVQTQKDSLDTLQRAAAVIQNLPVPPDHILEYEHTPGTASDFSVTGTPKDVTKAINQRIQKLQK